MNNFELIVDNRERKLIDILNNENIEFSIDQLDLGDIVYKKNGEEYIIIERKTVSDLVSSIRDSRAREQKRRLMDLKKQNPLLKVLYLIEGAFVDSKFGVSKNTLYSSVVNTMIRDNLFLLRTINITETKDFVIKIYNQLHKYNENSIVQNYENLEQKDIDYAALTHRKKKNNTTPTVCYINQLAQIPGISDITATSIADTYPSMIFLIESYLNQDDTLSKETLLADIMIISNNKSRRIGKVLSKRIYEYFNNI
jgi:ERCC4-type nuclease